MKTAVMFVVGAALILLCGAIAFSADAATDHGKAVYAAQKCSLCHSIAGVGNKKSPLDGVGAKIKADDMKKWIKTPKEMKADSKMKAYPSLPEKDLDDLTAYMLSLK